MTKYLSEADTRAKLITPAIYRRGWSEDMIRREETAGAIEKVGAHVRRNPNRRVDYALRVRVPNGTQPIAVALIEAKRNTASPADGLQQAKKYAALMNVPFVFSSNGYMFAEYNAADDTFELPRKMEEFPTPDDLLRRYEELRGFRLSEPSAKPLLMPYPGGDGHRRSYQDAAIRAALEKIVRCRKDETPARALLHLATGAGKTYIAAHLLKRIDEGGGMTRALFLCDRDALRAQALEHLRTVFGSDAEEVKRGADGKNIAANARVHIATYQTLGVDSESAESFGTEYYPETDYFSHIIIDECHRSAWNKWRGILDRNPNAVHIGLTATPRIVSGNEDDDKLIADNYNYFGEPVYSYGLAQGAEDGYLALCEIRQRKVNLDIAGLDMDEVMRHDPTNYRTGAPMTHEELRALYEKQNFEDILMLPDRVRAMCADLFAELAANGDPRQKTIIFCVRREHADAVSACMNNLYAEWRKKSGAAKVSDFAFTCMGDSGGDELKDFRAESAHHFIASTVDLLSTGVDIPRVRNIVFFRYVRSPILLHQMIGRGARIYEPEGKLSFVVHDYTNATDLLDEEWQTQIRDTDSDSDSPAPSEKESKDPPVLIQADGFAVCVSNSGSYIVVQDESGAQRRLSVEEYRRELTSLLMRRVKSADDLRALWADTRTRTELLKFMRDRQLSPVALRTLLQKEQYDDYDILAESAFGVLPRTRAERAESFVYKNEEWLRRFPPQTAAVLRALAGRFADGGIAELEDGTVFDTPEVKKAGGIAGLAKGGNPRELLRETKARLLAA